MTFESDYPYLMKFLLAWFADADLEGLNDNDVVNEFCKVTPRLRISEVIDECRRALVRINETCESIGIRANRSFVDQNEARLWLEMILKGLENGVNGK